MTGPVLRELDRRAPKTVLVCPLASISRAEQANLIINRRGGLDLLYHCGLFSSYPIDVPDAKLEASFVDGEFFMRVVAAGDVVSALQLFNGTP